MHTGAESWNLDKIVTTLKHGLPTFNIITVGNLSSDSSLAIHGRNEYILVDQID